MKKIKKSGNKASMNNLHQNTLGKNLNQMNFDPMNMNNLNNMNMGTGQIYNMYYGNPTNQAQTQNFIKNSELGGINQVNNFNVFHQSMGMNMGNMGMPNNNAPAGGNKPNFCPNCGTKTTDANFCPNCGQKLV